MKGNLFSDPIDQICLSLIAIFSLVITLLIGGSKICINEQCLFNNHPQVKEFSWQDYKIGASDTGFVLTFDRPMDRKTVEENLIIEPLLPGKISWAGRRLVYTLNAPIPYGKKYRLSLRDATEKFKGNNKLGTIIEPFVAEFQSRDRAFAYIASEGENTGQLILVNLTKENKTVLTPNNLAVVDFKFSKNGEFIVFSASDKKNGINGLRELELYRVSTGLSNNGIPQVPGEMELIIDRQGYQNNEFDLVGENGEIIIVQRINRENPADFDLWLIESEKSPKRLNYQGGEFLITPDGKNIAIAQGEGIAIIPLEKEGPPLDFLPKYGRILSFSENGTGAAMVNFNAENPELRYTKSLVYINNQGIEKELLNLKGSIIDCQFNYEGTHLYCLLTKLIEQQEEYREQPYFAVIDLKSNQVIPLLVLPNYQEIKLSIAPDNFGILFDQLIPEGNSLPQETEAEKELITDTNEPIIKSNLWLLTIPSSPSSQPQLEELPIAGFKPQWSP
jgi:hypothetical protein